MGDSEAWKQASSSSILLRYFCVVYTHTQSKTINILIETFRIAVALWSGSLEYVSIQ